ncbi:MAG: phosphatase PAP2 family protein [Parcubacteria group bacterium]
MNNHKKPILITIIISLALFAFMAVGVLFGGPMTIADTWINARVSSLWQPATNGIVIAITTIFQPEYVLIYSVVLLAIFLALKKKYAAKLLALAMVGGSALEIILKMIFNRPRPENFLLAEGVGPAQLKLTESFPSGHATVAIIFFAILFFAFKDKIKKPLLRWLFGAINVLLILIIGASRIYLNVHWLSDVIAGYALGLFWLTLSVFMINKLDLWIMNRKNPV